MRKSGMSDGKRWEIIVVSFWECGGSCDLGSGLCGVLMVAETRVEVLMLQSEVMIDGQC